MILKMQEQPAMFGLEMLEAHSVQALVLGDSFRIHSGMYWL